MPENFDVHFEGFEHYHDLSAEKRLNAIINQIVLSMRAGHERNEEHVKKIFKKSKELAYKTKDPFMFGVILSQSLLSLFDYPVQEGLSPETKKFIKECINTLFEEIKKSPRQIY
ncbi:MAG: hypothetical protein KAS78_02355 [Candidatus Pacebacteria bacterium]|nr:hypothetical protein [Candidatus Paceibacterota bacterium]